MRFSLNFEKIQPYVRWFDWILAIASLAYGIYTRNWIWIVASFIGFAIAWFDPGTRLRKRITFIKKPHDNKQ